MPSLPLACSINTSGTISVLATLPTLPHKCTQHRAHGMRCVQSYERSACGRVRHRTRTQSSGKFCPLNQCLRHKFTAETCLDDHLGF
jgi:hypothetical protein